MVRTLYTLLLVAFVAPAQVVADEADVREAYTKYEIQIPVRDGAKLFTAIYVPKDTSQDHPIMLLRTPYSASPYGVDHYPGSLGPSELFQESG